MRSYEPSPPVPVNPAIGTIWRPDIPKPAGPMTKPGEAQQPGKGVKPHELRGMAEGLIRVERVCSECGATFKGWMFLAIHRVRTKRGDFDPAAPFVVGVYGPCDPCIEAAEKRTEIARLEQVQALAYSHWQQAINVHKQLPPARTMLRSLKRLLELVEFGSPKMLRYSAAHDAVKQWLDEHASVNQQLAGMR